MSESNISLRPKARLLKALGEELISSEMVAVIEIVKNSYDADAVNVLVEFEGDATGNVSEIRITDDGHGMSRNVVQSAWLSIASSTKSRDKRSAKKRRRLLGEKGIGRFACAKLASTLLLVTKRIDSAQEVFVSFDWNEFNDESRFLDEITFEVKQRSPEVITPEWILRRLPTKIRRSGDFGTSMIMSNSKKDWHEEDFSELKRGLAKLVSPFKSNDDLNIYVRMPGEHEKNLTRVESPDFTKYPHYTISGSVEACGAFEFTATVVEKELSENFSNTFYRKSINGKWEIIDVNIPRDEALEDGFKPIESGRFDFEFYIWDRDDLGNITQKLSKSVRDVRTDLDSLAGINIYRDGFRVLPYGEPNNDWLRLDIRRVQKPTKRLSNNQIIGYINIGVESNPDLQDQSNREGLQNNQAYKDLEDITKHILGELESIRYSERRRDKSDQKGEGDGSKPLFEGPDFSEIKRTLKEKDGRQKSLDLVTQAEKEWNSQVKEFKSKLSQYHALATLGTLVDKVLHDGRQPLSNIQVDAGLGREDASSLIDSLQVDGKMVSERDISGFSDAFSSIVLNANVIRDVFRRMEPFGGRKRGRPKKYYAEDLIKDCFKNYEKDIRHDGVSVLLPDTQTLISVDITEFIEIVTNLLTNSLYWLLKVPRSKRYIRVSVSRTESKSMEILFSDSGPGVPKVYRDKIFEPYFSRKNGGTGLGLCLVGEIVKDYYGGVFELIDSGDKNGATFRVELRRRV